MLSRTWGWKVRAEQSRSVYNSEKLTAQESLRVISDYQALLCLTPNQIKRWGGKRFLVLIEIEKYQEVTPFAIDRSTFGNMDDWLPVDDVKSIEKPLRSSRMAE